MGNTWTNLFEYIKTMFGWENDYEIFPIPSIKKLENVQKDYICSLASYYSYKDKKGFERGMKKLLLKLKSPETKFFEDKKTDTQIHIISSDEIFIIAFRGSELKVKDWSRNLKFYKRRKSVGNEAMVHTGFKNGVEAIFTKPMLEFIMEKNKNSDREIWITGHSLGGALSTVATFLLKNSSYRNYNGELKHKVRRLCTFASPCVGDKEFVKVINEGKKDLVEPVYSSRYVYGNDLVPRVLRMGNYCHVNGQRLIDSDSMKITSGEPDLDLELNYESIIDHFMLNYVKALHFNCFKKKIGKLSVIKNKKDSKFAKEVKSEFCT